MFEIAWVMMFITIPLSILGIGHLYFHSIYTKKLDFDRDIGDIAFGITLAILGGSLLGSLLAFAWPLALVIGGVLVVSFSIAYIIRKVIDSNKTKGTKNAES